MKKLMITLAAMVVAFGATTQSQASDLFLTRLNYVTLTESVKGVQPLDLINWKVGDQMDYNVSAGFFGSGNSVKKVTKDEGAAIWIEQVINVMGQNQTAQMLINKADGKILKLIQNGQEQQVPNEQPEIISQDYTNVTVPAGTFKCMHIVGKTSQIKQFEAWINPTVSCMDGTLKQVMDAGFVTITMELKSFKKN